MHTIVLDLVGDPGVADPDSPLYYQLRSERLMTWLDPARHGWSDIATGRQVLSRLRRREADRWRLVILLREADSVQVSDAVPMNWLLLERLHQLRRDVIAPVAALRRTPDETLVVVYESGPFDEHGVPLALAARTAFGLDRHGMYADDGPDPPGLPPWVVRQEDVSEVAAAWRDGIEKLAISDDDLDVPFDSLPDDRRLVLESAADDARRVAGGRLEERAASSSNPDSWLGSPDRFSALGERWSERLEQLRREPLSAWYGLDPEAAFSAEVRRTFGLSGTVETLRMRDPRAVEQPRTRTVAILRLRGSTPEGAPRRTRRLETEVVVALLVQSPSDVLERLDGPQPWSVRLHADERAMNSALLERARFLEAEAATVMAHLERDHGDSPIQLLEERDCRCPATERQGLQQFRRGDQEDDALATIGALRRPGPELAWDDWLVGIESRLAEQSASDERELMKCLHAHGNPTRRSTEYSSNPEPIERLAETITARLRTERTALYAMAVKPPTDAWRTDLARVHARLTSVLAMRPDSNVLLATWLCLAIALSVPSVWGRATRDWGQPVSDGLQWASMVALVSLLPVYAAIGWLKGRISTLSHEARRAAYDGQKELHAFFLQRRSQLEQMCKVRVARENADRVSQRVREVQHSRIRWRWHRDELKSHADRLFGWSGEEPLAVPMTQALEVPRVEADRPPFEQELYGIGRRLIVAINLAGGHQPMETEAVVMPGLERVDLRREDDPAVTAARGGRS